MSSPVFLSLDDIYCRKVEKREFFVYVCVWVGGGVWMGVGCPCPPVHNDIVSHMSYCDPASLIQFDNGRFYVKREFLVG